MEIMKEKRKDKTGDFDAVEYFENNRDRLLKKHGLFNVTNISNPLQGGVPSSATGVVFQTTAAKTAYRYFLLNKASPINYTNLNKIIDNYQSNYQNNPSANNLALLEGALQDKLALEQLELGTP